MPARGFYFVLFGRALLTVWVYNGGVPRGDGLPLVWTAKELVVSIIPALVSMQVLKDQGRWPGADGVYGGYPTSCYEAPARPVVGGARIAPVSYAPSARGGSSASGRGYRPFDGLSLLALLFGLLSLVAGVGFLAVCVYARLWALCVLPGVLFANAVYLLYFSCRK